MLVRCWGCDRPYSKQLLEAQGTVWIVGGTTEYYCVSCYCRRVVEAPRPKTRPVVVA